MVQSEFAHFKRSPFKIISLILFLMAIVYGCQNGYDLLNRHDAEIMSIKSINEDSINKAIIQFEEIEKGPIDKPRRDPTVPYWAIWNTPSYAFKYPSPIITNSCIDLFDLLIDSIAFANSNMFFSLTNLPIKSILRGSSLYSKIHELSKKILSAT